MRTAQKMDSSGTDLLTELQSEIRALCLTAKTASKNGKGLAGHNFYANKFHDHVLRLTACLARLNPLIKAGVSDTKAVAEFEQAFATITSPSNTLRQRLDAEKQIALLSQSTFIPALTASTEPISKDEKVLPLAVVKGTRGYLEKLAVQANVCYENKCYDACSVIIRKLAEILIIEVYESAQKAGDIKNNAGEFLMLRDLITKILAETSWSLGRETRAALPQLKSAGDRSAHNRRYVATKPDVDSILSGLRVVVDDLLHLAGLK